MPVARTPQDKAGGMSPKQDADYQNKLIEVLTQMNFSASIGSKIFKNMRRDVAELAVKADEFQKRIHKTEHLEKDLKIMTELKNGISDVSSEFSKVVSSAKGLYDMNLLSKKVLDELLDDEKNIKKIQEDLSSNNFINIKDKEFFQSMVDDLPKFEKKIENVATALSGPLSQLSKISTEIGLALIDPTISEAVKAELESGKVLIEGLNLQDATAEEVSKKLMDVSKHLEKASGMKGFEKSSALTSKSVLDATKGSERMSKDFKENADNVSKIQKAMSFMGGMANVAGAKTAGGAIQGLGGVAQTALGASPWGAVIGALAGIAAAVVEFSDSNKQEGRELRRSLTYAGGNFQYIPESEMGKFSKALQVQLQTAFPWLSDKDVFESTMKGVGAGMATEATRGGLPQDYDKQVGVYVDAAKKVKELEEQITILRTTYTQLAGGNAAAGEASLQLDANYQKLNKQLQEASKTEKEHRSDVSKTTSDIMKMYISMSEKYGISVDVLLNNFEVMRRAYGKQLRDIKTAGDRYEFLDYKMAKFSITAKASEFNLQDWMSMLIPSSQRLKNFGLTLDDTNALMFQFGDKLHDNIISIDDLVSSIQEGLGGAFNPNKWAIVLQTLQGQGMYSKSPALQKMRTLDPMKQMAMISAAVEGGAAGQNLLQQSPEMLNFFKTTFGDSAEAAFNELGKTGKEVIQELREGTTGPFQGQGPIMSQFLGNITGFSKDFGMSAQTWTESLSKFKIDLTQTLANTLPAMIETMAGTLHGKDIQFQTTVTEALGAIQADFRSIIVGNKVQVEIKNNNPPEAGKREK